MPVGMQTSSGNAGNSNGNAAANTGDAGFLANMKAFFGGKSPESQEPQDPWAEEAAVEQAKVDAAKPKPLADYNDLFNPKSDPNAVAPIAPVDPFAAVTRENLANAAENLDFSSAVDEATMTAALAGDATAMRLAINKGARGAFTEAMSASNTLMQKRINDAVQTQVSELIKTKFKDMEIHNEVSNNPLLSDPATKPMRDMLTQQIKAANPNFTGKEINTALTGYLTSFIAAHAPTGSSTAGKSMRLGKAIESAADF